MSRIGKLPIPVEPGVTVTIEGQDVTVSGPKGTLSRIIRPEITCRLENGSIVVSRRNESKLCRSLHGLSRTLLANMVEGVTKGYTKTLEIVGVGYRVSLQGKKLVMSLGYSHPVEIIPPAGIEFAVEEKANRIHVKGIDPQIVGDVAAEIRFKRPPEPYKGKGVKYQGEVIRRKVGKAGGKKK
ncbi:MAG: 50S ribosomal protein L6 [Cyanobacteria bacterium NC_groundwater_1444_Ag_S-0.65um_54_12]|nr:50S ribosomal protein L6 [Cyanobacteria bacterium NC_groundwater_1444_Ag_S-0.65um_54_12]